MNNPGAGLRNPWAGLHRSRIGFLKGWLYCRNSP